MARLFENLTLGPGISSAIDEDVGIELQGCELICHNIEELEVSLHRYKRFHSCQSISCILSEYDQATGSPADQGSCGTNTD